MSNNPVRDAILAAIAKANGEQSADQITRAIALSGLVGQELPLMVNAGLIIRTTAGNYTTRANVAQQIAAHEAALQKLREDQAELDADAEAVAAPVVPVVATAPAAKAQPIASPVAG
jgi:hypothetical protein